MVLAEIMIAAVLMLSVAVLFMIFRAHAGRELSKQRHYRALEHELDELKKAKLNKALVIAFITVLLVTAMPLISASATGAVTGIGSGGAVDGRLVVIALLALFTAGYVIIVIHTAFGRD